MRLNGNSWVLVWMGTCASVLGLLAGAGAGVKGGAHGKAGHQGRQGQAFRQRRGRHSGILQWRGFWVGRLNLCAVTVFRCIIPFLDLRGQAPLGAPHYGDGL